MYARTKKVSDYGDFDPLVFSSDRRNSYTSYSDCLRGWVMKSLSNPSMNVSKMMKKAAGIEDKKAVEVLKDDDESIDRDMNIDISVYNDFENAFQCSGMCRPALFFFNLKITEHPPPK
jgi:hypothetical protein